jgi:hypothetical protein
LTQYVFEEGLEIRAKDSANILDQNGPWFESAHGTEHLRKEITLVLLRAMLTTEAEGLAGRSSSK